MSATTTEWIEIGRNATELDACVKVYRIYGTPYVQHTPVDNTHKQHTPFVSYKYAAHRKQVQRHRARSSRYSIHAINVVSPILIAIGCRSHLPQFVGETCPKTANNHILCLNNSLRDLRKTPNNGKPAGVTVARLGKQRGDQNLPGVLAHSQRPSGRRLRYGFCGSLRVNLNLYASENVSGNQGRVSVDYVFGAMRRVCEHYPSIFSHIIVYVHRSDQTIWDDIKCDARII